MLHMIKHFLCYITQKKSLRSNRKERYTSKQIWYIPELYMMVCNMVALILNLHHRQPKEPFFLKSNLTRWLLSLGRGSQLSNLILSWYKLIQLDTELTMKGFTLVPSRWLVLALALTHYVNLLWLSGAISNYLSLSVQKTQLPVQSGPSSGLWL